MSEKKMNLSRRSFLKLMGVAAGQFFLMGAGGMTYSTRLEPAWLEIKEVKLKLPRLAREFDNFRVVQVSDIHLGGWMNLERLNYVLGLALNLKPDLLALTGDFVEYVERPSLVQESISDLATALEVLKNLSIPRIAVLGNHDVRTAPDDIRKLLKQFGIIDLTNTVYSLTRGAANLHLAGVDDLREGRPDLKAVMQQLPEDGAAAIMFSHEPDFADESAQTGRFDLQLSGHSHGGQVVLPFIGPPILPDGGRKYYDGLYKVGSMLQYTTRGVGVTAPFIRFNCRPELTAITLEAG